MKLNLSSLLSKFCSTNPPSIQDLIFFLLEIEFTLIVYCCFVIGQNSLNFSFSYMAMMFSSTYIWGLSVKFFFQLIYADNIYFEREKIAL